MDETQNDELFAEYQRIGRQIDDLKNKREEEVESAIAGINKEIVELKRLADARVNAQKAADNAASETSSADALQKRVVDLRLQIQKFKDSNPGVNTGSMLTDLANEAEVTAEKLAEVQLEFSKIKESRYRDSGSGVEAQYKREQGHLRSVIDLRTKLQKFVIENTEAYEANKSSIDAWIDKLQHEGSVTITVLQDIKTAFGKITERAGIDAAKQKSIDNIRADVQKYIGDNPRAYLAYFSQLSAIMHDLENASDLTEAQILDIARAFEDIQSKAHKAGRSGKFFGDSIAAAWNKFKDAISITSILTAAWTTIKNMTQSVRELDSAMTELKKVTDLTAASYTSFFNKAVVMAKEVGATVVDTISATADFSRLGYGIGDASYLAQTALMYKNVGDGVSNITDATESLISTMKAFGVEAEDSMHIIDAFNEVGNNFSISSTGLGESLRRSASALAAAGNTMEESIGLITAMNNVLQNPEVTGTTIKTISMYLRAAKTEEAGFGSLSTAQAMSTATRALVSLSSIGFLIQPKLDIPS